MKYSLTVLIFLCTLSVYGQPRQKFVRLIQFSLTPGLSTNGIHPGSYANYFSFNATSGYSKANYLLEISIISNLNVAETRGLQLGGIANLTGANAFAGLMPREIDKKRKEGWEANLSGLQLSGLTNFVLNNVFGGQITAGVNVAKGSLQGVQLAGLSNTVLKYSFGLQLAGLYNVSIESMDGVQVSSLFNLTTGGLYGVQIGSFNRARSTEGINSFNNTDTWGVQIGLVNKTTFMNGFQIGLINISKRMQGTQIGIINIFNNGLTPQTRDGTPIGLINIGSSGYASAYANETFLMNIEIGTGSSKNKRITTDADDIQWQNALIYSRGPASLEETGQWALGYGVKKFYFNRSTAPGFGHMKFVSFGVDFMHLNHERKRITKELSLIAKPNLAMGSRFHPKNKNVFFMAGLSYNVYYSKSRYAVNSIFKKSIESEGSRKLQHWPGLTLGVLVQ
jgi:hypothetical protein